MMLDISKLKTSKNWFDINEEYTSIAIESNAKMTKSTKKTTKKVTKKVTKKTDKKLKTNKTKEWVYYNNNYKHINNVFAYMPTDCDDYSYDRLKGRDGICECDYICRCEIITNFELHRINNSEFYRHLSGKNTIDCIRDYCLWMVTKELDEGDFSHNIEDTYYGESFDGISLNSHKMITLINDINNSKNNEIDLLNKLINIKLPGFGNKDWVFQSEKIDVYNVITKNNLALSLKRNTDIIEPPECVVLCVKDQSRGKYDLVLHYEEFVYELILGHEELLYAHDFIKNYSKDTTYIKVISCDA